MSSSVPLHQERRIRRSLPAHYQSLFGQILNSYQYAKFYHGYSTLFFRKRLERSILRSEQGGDIGDCPQSLLETHLESYMRSLKPNAEDKQLWRVVDGRKYFFLKETDWQGGQNQEYIIHKDLLLFGMTPQHLQHNEYFAVARVSPCSQTQLGVAAQNHLEALNAHMQQVLDIKIEASKEKYLFIYQSKLSRNIIGDRDWREFKEGVVKFKRNIQPGVTKNLVLIWNTAAGFSDNFNVLLDCCGTFTHLAYFDCEFDGKVMHQVLRFVQCTNVIDFLKKVCNGNDNLSLNRVSQFRSDRLFMDVCSLESLKRAAGYAEALNFFKAMVISLNDIFHRTMPRSENQWYNLHPVQILDKDDEEDFYSKDAHDGLI